MFLKKKIPETITFETLFDIIQPGNRIFISSGPATPVKTITAIQKALHSNLTDLEIIQLSTPDNLFLFDEAGSDKFRLKTFTTGESIEKNMREGRVDLIPTHIAGLRHIFVSGAVGVDIAIVQTSPPNSKGNLNLGTVIDVSDVVINRAPIVIAEINPNVPTTTGETTIHMNQVDYFIESEEPLVQIIPSSCDPVLDKIAWNIGNLVEDGATISLQMGRIFDAIARHLHSKKDLKIFTHVVSDWIIGLIESGAISDKIGLRKQRPVTTTSCFGTSVLYDYVANNPYFDFSPLLNVSYQTMVPHIKKFVGILNVNKIDLSGDNVAVSDRDLSAAGFNSKLHFSLGAAYSRDGKSIVALRSTGKDGQSNIVVKHTDDRNQIRSTHGSTRYVVTEYGVAHIFGKSIRERTIEMIDIAHPKFREQLFEEAKHAGYLYPDQIFIQERALNYPHSLETIKNFGRGVEVKFRPIKATDEERMRRLFYKFSEESKYFRFFTPMRSMPYKMMQSYLNVDYEKSLSIVGLIDKGEDVERIIAEGRFSYNENQDHYEIAFIVDEDYQSRGIARFMINYLFQIARDKGIKKLFANVLQNNERMVLLLKYLDVRPEITSEDGEMQFLYSL